MSTPQESLKKAKLNTLFLADSGAEVSAAPTGLGLSLTSNATSTTDLVTASNQLLPVLGVGNMSPYVTDVHVAKDLAFPIASVSNLTNRLWCIFPPKSLGGGFIGVEEDGEIVLKSDGQSYWFDPKGGHFGYCNLPIMSISPQEHLRCTIPTIATVRSHIDSPAVEKSIQAMVIETQAKLQSLPKEVLVELADSGAINNFPVTAQQIKRFAQQDVSYIKGNIRKSSLWDHINDGEYCEPGDKVSTDKMGPISPPTVSGADGIHVYIDKATRFGFCIIGRYQTSEELSKYHSIANSYYKLHGHRIRVLQQDALPAAMSASAQTEAMDEEIDLRFKAPYQHEGQDESFVKTLARSIAVAFAWAVWMPRALWGFATRRQLIIYNLRLAPGGSRMTRQEAFTGKRPDFKFLPIGRFGAPYIILVDTAQKEWKFDSNGIYAAYLCPDERSKDVHFFYRWDTKRVCRRRSFQALDFVPTEWKNDKPDRALKIIFETQEDKTIWDENNIYVEKTHEGRVTRSMNQFAPVNILSALSSQVSPVSNLIDTTSSRVAGRPLNPNDEPLRGPSGGVTAQPDVCSDERNEVMTIDSSDVSDETQRGTYLHNERTERIIHENIENSKHTESAQHSHENSVSDDFIHNPNLTNNYFSSSSFQIPKRIRVTIPISETVQKVVNVNTKKCLSRAGITSDEAMDIIKARAATILIQENSNNKLQPPRWARRKLLLAVRKATKSRTDNPTVKMALQSADWREWIEAIDKEFQTQEEGQQWEVVLQIPPGQQILPSHLVLVQKRDSKGNKTKKKGRLVAGGNYQDSSLLAAISSPTCRSASVKILFSIAAKQGLKVRMADVKAAYTKAFLDESETTYLRLPPRPREINGKCVIDETPTYVRLIRSLYGLKQAGLLWNKLITKTLLDYGCQQLESDPCLFTYTSGEQHLYIAMYVDDLLFCSTDDSIVDNLLKYLEEQFGEVSEVTEGQSHLGLFIEHLPDGSIKLSQPGYIAKILRELDMEDLLGKLTVPTPLDPAGEPKRVDTTLLKENNDYRKIIGLLMHAAIHTRPDILYAVSYLATKLAKPTAYDRKQAIRVVKYLAGTPTLGLTFTSHGPVELFGYVDASYLTHPDAKGHSGMSFTIGEDNAAFYSRSFKQKLVGRSSTEAEIQALDQAVVEVEWLRWLLFELGYSPNDPTIIFQDNMSCIQIANGTADVSPRTRHYAMRYFYVRQAVEEHSVVLQYLSTHDHTADILTKQPSTVHLFLSLRSKLMNCANTPSGL